MSDEVLLRSADLIAARQDLQSAIRGATGVPAGQNRKPSKAVGLAFFESPFYFRMGVKCI